MPLGKFQTILIYTSSFGVLSSSSLYEIIEEGLSTLGSDTRWETIFEIYECYQKHPGRKPLLSFIRFREPHVDENSFLSFPFLKKPFTDQTEGYISALKLDPIARIRKEG